MSDVDDEMVERLVEQMVRQHGPEMAALRKLAYWGVDDDDEDVPLPVAVSETIARLDELESHVEKQQQVIHRFEEIQTDVGNKTTTIAKIVSYADRVREGSVVTVRPKEMKGAADISKRYAYDLVDEIDDTYDWAWDPRSEQRAADEHSRNKALRIDFELLHQDRAALNQFNNALEQEAITV